MRPLATFVAPRLAGYPVGCTVSDGDRRAALGPCMFTGQTEEGVLACLVVEVNLFGALELYARRHRSFEPRPVVDALGRSPCTWAEVDWAIPPSLVLGKE